MDIQEMTGELREERAFLYEARHTMAMTAHGSGSQGFAGQSDHNAIAMR